jgi:phage protein D
MAAQRTLISQFFLRIDGSAAPRALMDDLMEVVVEDNLHLPDMFSIHLHDGQLRWINSALLRVGQSVEITAQGYDPQTRRPGPRAVLMAGEITGLEPDMLDSGVPSLVIRGYDRSHRLHQGRQFRSFLQVTDDELAQRIAAEVGLQADVLPTNQMHEQVIQRYQTNMEFLQERAWRLGYRLAVEGETLYFGPPAANGSGQPPCLTWGVNLLNFQASLTTIQQVDEVVVRGWDPMSKQRIVGRAGRSELTPQVKGRGRAEPRFKGSNQVVVSYPVQSQAEADSLAQAWRDEMGGELIRAEGVCLGEPQVRAGQEVEIAGVGEQFNGRYVVSSAAHSYSGESGYETRFSVGGCRADTLTALLAGTGQQDPIQGVVVGLVTNNNDPAGLGRVKVTYPGLDDIDESPWVRIAGPMAGERRGFFCLPEINDEVLVAFEQGDVHRPYLLGMLWNGPDRPPRTNQAVVGGDGRVNQRLIRSRSGHEIVLDDTAGREQVVVSDQSGNRIVLAGGEMSIKVEGDLILKASGKVTLEAGSQIKLKGEVIEVG